MKNILTGCPDFASGESRGCKIEDPRCRSCALAQTTSGQKEQEQKAAQEAKPTSLK